MLSYGLDRLAETQPFMNTFLELHSLCSSTGLAIQFIDLHDVEGRARWLLGVLEMLVVERSSQFYEEEDFVKAFNKIRKESEEKVQRDKDREFREKLQEEKERWDDGHGSAIRGDVEKHP